MTATTRSLIAPTANPLLERALRDKLTRRSEDVGSLGELEPLALRLGLMQNTLKPQMVDPQLLIVASDHGLAVDGGMHPEGHSTADDVRRILLRQMPVSVFAQIQGIGLTVVDAGIADRLAPHERLLLRKIAHGTRHTRAGLAMTVDQAHAAIRAGMEIGNHLPGNAVACAGLGVGSGISAALVLARLTGVPVRDLLVSGSVKDPAAWGPTLAMVQAAQSRHRDVSDPVEVMAAFGGFEMAMLTGVMLSAAQRRSLVMVDGMAACAALMLASRIAPAVTDYCVFCRSQQHQGLDYALHLFNAGALLELGMNSVDGSGAAIAWPLIRTAAALLTEVASGEDPGPTLPGTELDGLREEADALRATPDEALLLALGGARTGAVVAQTAAGERDLHRGGENRPVGAIEPIDEADATNSKVAPVVSWRSALINLDHRDEKAAHQAMRDSELPTR